jgi:hypothetical protein
VAPPTAIGSGRTPLEDKTQVVPSSSDCIQRVIAVKSDRLATHAKRRTFPEGSCNKQGDAPMLHEESVVIVAGVDHDPPGCFLET